MIKTVPIIRSSNSWKKLFAQCKKLPKKEKGDVFQTSGDTVPKDECRISVEVIQRLAAEQCPRSRKA